MLCADLGDAICLISLNTLKYKGLVGSVAFSEEDNVFFGKIEGIDGLVNFEGSSVEELKSAFHEAVDDYLAYCEEEEQALSREIAVLS